MSGAKLLERICDKKQLCSFLQSEGLPAPKLIDVASLVLKFRSLARHGGLGIFNLQIISAGSECFISDVNPRMGSSAVFGYGLGVNLPVFVCSPAAKVEPAGTHSLRRPLTMVRHLEELFVRNEGLDGIRGVIFDLDDTLLD